MMRAPTLLAVLAFALAPAVPAAQLEVDPALARDLRLEPPLDLPAAPAPPQLFPLRAVDGAAPGLGVPDALAPAAAPPPPPTPDPAPAIVAAAGGFALLGGLRWLTLGAVALYSRLTRNELLDNAHRDKVFRLVRETPGLGVTAIMQAAGLGWGTTVYHLDRLERAGMVASERVGLHRCYFPVGTLPREDRRRVATLQAAPMRELAQAVAAAPGATQSELCAATGLSASALSKQVTKLENAGLVRRERDGKTSRLYPTLRAAPNS